MSHYILVLSTPFAVLIALFYDTALLASARGRLLAGFRKYFSLFVFIVGIVGLFFLDVFILKDPLWRVVISLVILAGIVVWLIRTTRPMAIPAALGIFVAVMLFQSSQIASAGFAAHTIMQKFAKTIHDNPLNNAIIGVGSHDIHEKEFQVFFGRKVIKAAFSKPEQTREGLRKLLAADKPVYCLILKRDYPLLKEVAVSRKLTVIQTENMVRKRFHLDGSFIHAIFSLDRPRVRDYLLEKVFLVKIDG